MHCHLATALGLFLVGTQFFGCHAAEPVSAETRKLLEVCVGEFVEITPGTGTFPAAFTLGDPEASPREVQMKASFAISKYEVYQNLYEAVTGKNPSRWKGTRNSTEQMTWQEAQGFCERLTELLHQEKLLPENEVIRLPTEEEWEYCCRAGTTTAYSFGDNAQAEGESTPQASILNKYGWHTGNAAGNDPAVGVLAPNPWGLYDMHGYLWEYCQDGPDTHELTCVVRGGSWKDPYGKLRSFSRKEFSKSGRDDAVGFRCVRAKK